MTTIEFWFSIGSTYSYLALSRLSVLEEQYAVRFIMKPFNVRQLMQEQSGNPFLNNEKKMSYMWRDIERRAGKYGIDAQFPVQYPMEEFVLTNQMAVLATQEGWCRDFALRVYHHWFAHGVVGGSKENITRSLLDIDQDPDRIYQLAASEELVTALNVETDKARELGFFGTPNFVVGTEVFWGDDRAEDAIEYALTDASTAL